MSSSPPESPGRVDYLASVDGRFVFIDAMRGIAALGVLVSHLVRHITWIEVAEASLPSWLMAIGAAGAHGVEVFFVLSGFVIAHSLIHRPTTVRSLGQFAWRRQVRLDPTYWAVMVLVLAFSGTRDLMRGDSVDWLLDPMRLLANATYLHEVTGCQGIVGVAWTLCLEIQFYVVFVLGLYLTARIVGLKLLRPGRFMVGAVASTALMSMVLLAQRGAQGHPVWFWYPWCYFALGALTYWFLRGWVAWPVWGVVFAGLVGLAVYDASIEVAIGVAAVLSIVLVGWTGRLGQWSLGRGLQFAGATSYSLYLIHGLVIDRVSGLAARVSAGAMGFALFFVAGTVLSVAAGYLLYRLVERPTQRWASRIGRRESAEEDRRSSVAIGHERRLEVTT